jgi:hypothetical protein
VPGPVLYRSYHPQADPQRGLRRLRTAVPDARHLYPEHQQPRSTDLGTALRQPGNGESECRRRRGLAAIQPDRRHAPDSLPCGECANHSTPAIQW